MKIITFWGGLGNQLFEYAYFSWLKQKFPNERFYGYYPSVGLSSHNGLEINNDFEVELPPESCFSNFLGNCIFNLNRLLRRLHLSEFATCTQNNERYSRVFHCDYWQDKKYLTNESIFKFKTDKINNKNSNLEKEILSCNSVAIHVRRGDYLSEKNKVIYGNICTDKYYQSAINMISGLDNVKYYVFSDDIEYVRNSLHLPNMIIVDWNKGKDSIYDMYLMSRCKFMVLANSTFSYWAARLNPNVKKIVCPNRWTNLNTEPDIIIDSWIKI